jgi:hypothetical protein
MKIYTLLPLAILALTLQPVCAGNSELEEPDYADLPHAFDAGWAGQKTCEVLFEDETTRVGRCVQCKYG